jgi:hypothetical protein
LFDITIIILMFAMIFRFLPDAKIAWRDVWTGAALTAILFVVGKLLLGLYLGSGAAGSAYGAAGSLVTLLLWVFYSAQILLFGAEFTKVYANTYGSRVMPEPHAVRVERREIELSDWGGVIIYWHSLLRKGETMTLESDSQRKISSTGSTRIFSAGGAKHSSNTGVIGQLPSLIQNGPVYPIGTSAWPLYPKKTVPKIRLFRL